jgi:hypothetical protein
MVASLLWASMTFFVEPKISMRAGHIEISAIEPEDAINLFIFVTLFFGGIGLVIRGLIQFSPAP